MFNMGPVWGLHYNISPPNSEGWYQVYSECYRNYPDGNGFQTYRNDCGSFKTIEEAKRAKEILSASLHTAP